jgi:transposase-like protein
MSRPRKYPEELIERGVRLALESGRPIRHVAADLGIPWGAQTRPRSQILPICREDRIERPTRSAFPAPTRVRRRDLLGGLIREYLLAA